MLHLSQLLFASTAVLFLSGCANQLVVTVNSEPPGAQIMEIDSGLQKGLAPVSVAYDLNEIGKFKDASGCFVVSGFTAQWVSGARNATERKLRICSLADGQQTTISRPANAPNLAADMARAQMHLSTQRPVAPAPESPSLLLINSYIDGRNESIRQQNQTPPARPINCQTTSNWVGSALNTTCK